MYLRISVVAELLRGPTLKTKNLRFTGKGVTCKKCTTFDATSLIWQGIMRLPVLPVFFWYIRQFENNFFRILFAQPLMDEKSEEGRAIVEKVLKIKYSYGIWHSLFESVTWLIHDAIFILSVFLKKMTKLNNKITTCM